MIGRIYLGTLKSLFALVRLASWGHQRLSSRIIRSELGHRVCLMTGCASCDLQEPPWLDERKLHQLRSFAARMTECWWNYTLGQGSAERNKEKKQGKVIGEEDIPGNIVNLLGKRARYGAEPSVPALELVALNRRVATKAGNENRERCLLEGVHCLL